MITLTPAYDRDYKSQKAVKEAIDKNEDFILNDYNSPWNGKPVSPKDLLGNTVVVRYGKLRKVMQVKL